MLRQIRVLALVVLLAVSSAPARAQLSGIPVPPAPSGTGIFLSGDYGDPGSGSAWGATAGLGLGRLGFSAGVGSRDLGSSDEDVTTLGFAAGLRLLSAGPVAIGAQVGASSFEVASDTRWDILPGISAKADLVGIPLKPWGVLYGALTEGGDDEVRFSIGTDLNLAPAIGVHAAYDWGDSHDVWGVGAHFKFTVPGLPVI